MSPGPLSRAAARRIAEIRRELDHPIVDADGHLLESVPLPAMIGEKTPWARDEFEDSGLRGPDDLARIFGEHFAFGCEGGDLSVHRALDGAGNALGVALRPLFSSDIGHWDVPELGDPLPESYAQVASGRLSRAGYRCFAFEEPVRLHLAGNPHFFEGTAVESAARELLA